MLEIFGTIAGNILSLPGILGLALGIMTRNPMLGAALGAIVGISETLIFAGFQFGQIEMIELVIAVGVGAVFGVIGSLIRIKGATV